MINKAEDEDICNANMIHIYMWVMDLNDDVFSVMQLYADVSAEEVSAIFYNIN